MGGPGAGVSGDWSGERRGVRSGFESGRVVFDLRREPCGAGAVAFAVAAARHNGGRECADRRDRGAIGLRIAAADQHASAVGSNTRQRDPDRDARRRGGIADRHHLRGRHAGVAASQTVIISVAGPAIFTLYGSQEAAALNQDYSVNSQDNPAAARQAILLFGTGLGAVSPPVPTGAAASADPLSWVTANVTAAVTLAVTHDS